ncbi:TonB-dependent receptor, partial [Pseudoalteromonas sp. S3173]|uniref:TonB-dependent receptor domain-containing protein n=1 Tax=Pseudoalteromonas sp. S3173 TaxID=579531 RepID=UPI00110CE76A
IDLDDYTASDVSQKLDLIYQVDDNLSWDGQYVRGFKKPPHDQAYQSQGVEPYYQILPNPDLDPERSDSFEIGLSYASSDIRLNLRT